MASEMVGGLLNFAGEKGLGWGVVAYLVSLLKDDYEKTTWIYYMHR